MQLIVQLNGMSIEKCAVTLQLEMYGESDSVVPKKNSIWVFHVVSAILYALVEVTL